MNFDTNTLQATVLVGIGATVCMDLWAVLLKRAFNSPPPNYCFVGRWLCHMREGKFRHHNITAATQKPHECAIGWFTHYIIGVTYALLLVFLASSSWLQAPTILPALLLGIVTVAFPFLVMQPAFGMGFAGSNAPNPLAIRLRSLMNHTVFGLGLYITALLIP